MLAGENATVKISNTNYTLKISSLVQDWLSHLCHLVPKV